MICVCRQGPGEGAATQHTRRLTAELTHGHTLEGCGWLVATWQWRPSIVWHTLNLLSLT